jgi:dihydroneopterin aldolase
MDNQSSVPGRVELRGLRCQSQQLDGDGAVSNQLLVADVAIDLDLSAVAQSDSYADVVDLSDLAATLRETIANPPRLLLETTAVHAARQVLDQYPRVQGVRLRLAKPNPPGLDANEEAVEVRLTRGSV